VHTDTVNNMVQANYTHNKANNRTTVVRVKPPQDMHLAVDFFSRRFTIAKPKEIPC